MTRRSLALALALAPVLGCSRPGSDPPRGSADAERGPAEAPLAEADAAPEPPPQAPSVPSDAGSGDRVDAGGVQGPASDASSSEPASAPKVKVFSIGMHVAGGPFDEATKKPFLADVEPHYGALAQCWTHVTAHAQADVGVDIRIPAEGGRAQISNPRSTMKAEGFVPCVVAFFEGIAWAKPKRGGVQVLSYSVRFKPL